MPDGSRIAFEECLRLAITALCQALDIPLTAARKRQLPDMKHDALRELLPQIAKQQRWPARGR